MTDTSLFPRSRSAQAAKGATEPVFGDGAPGSAALSRPAVADLFYRVRCFIFRMHDFQVKVAPGRVCLACHHCGKTSLGWEMSPPMGVASERAVVKSEKHAGSLQEVPMRMAKVLHHSPRAQQQKRAAAN